MKNKKPRFHAFEIVFLGIMLMATLCCGMLMLEAFPNALDALAGFCGQACAG